jgi:hypothetical protein
MVIARGDAETLKLRIAQAPVTQTFVTSRFQQAQTIIHGFLRARRALE